MTTKKKAPESQETFTKEALLTSGYFDNRKDALAVLIEDGESITIAEAQARLAEFLKRKVK
ncbi:hypothetical protein AALA22_10910 [Anaerovoracaceae bacterium 41-7]|jgi:hypothetical protein|uniref:hypothetical protein n=1 Tax=Senimuribacter intestinalis TaxID=2941507 RepID=UPI00203A8047|nr:hypothetical protein [Senimuribacter intestinalis]